MDVFVYCLLMIDWMSDRSSKLFGLRVHFCHIVSLSRKNSVFTLTGVHFHSNKSSWAAETQPQINKHTITQWTFADQKLWTFTENMFTCNLWHRTISGFLCVGVGKGSFSWVFLPCHRCEVQWSHETLTEKGFTWKLTSERERRQTWGREDEVRMTLLFYDERDTHTVRV